MARSNVNDWRQDHLERLDELEAAGVEQVEWSTAGDEHVCPRCAAREGRKFTLAQMRRELETEFCTPADIGDRCRCVIVAAG